MRFANASVHITVHFTTHFNLLPLERGFSTSCLHEKLNSGICVLLYTIILRPTWPLQQIVSCIFTLIYYNEVLSTYLLKTLRAAQIKNTLKCLPYVQYFVLYILYCVWISLQPWAIPRVSWTNWWEYLALGKNT